MCVYEREREGERERERDVTQARREKVGDKTAAQASSDVVMPFAAEGG
jgi:hypothetical protein